MIPISKPFIGPEEREAVLSVLESGILAMGPKTAAFEEQFAELCGVRHAVAISSGTAALCVALMAHEIGPGDEVITTPFTFIASANSILSTGARPVFVDIEEDSFNIDPVLVDEAVTRKTKAIMPVHLYGQTCDMDALQDIARRHRLTIIEDACQAVGATYRGRAAGSFGTGVFSLYATKNIMTGEGGMITTDDAEVADRARLIRNQGMRRRYYHDMLGYNFRMSDLHASLGLAQMARLEGFTEARRRNAAILSARIESVATPKVREGNGHVWHQYTVRAQGDRDAAVKQLNDAGVGTGVFYPVPAHKQDFMRRIVGEFSCPIAESAAQEVISLPVHPQITLDDLDRIVTEVNKL